MTPQLIDRVVQLAVGVANSAVALDAAEYDFNSRPLEHAWVAFREAFGNEPWVQGDKVTFDLALAIYSSTYTHTYNALMASTLALNAAQENKLLRGLQAIEDDRPVAVVLPFKRPH
jgi:hypothetical protein